MKATAGPNQIFIDWTSSVHVRENSQANEDHLNLNRQKFTGQNAIVLTLLQQGVPLTTRSAMLQYNIGHLARRIKDLEDNPKTPVTIDREFTMDKQRKITRYLVYFLPEFRPLFEKKNIIPTAYEIELHTQYKNKKLHSHETEQV